MRLDMRIATDRLLISNLSEKDAGFIVELVNTPGWLRFIGDKRIANEQDAIQYLHNGPIRSYTDNGFGLYRVGLPDEKTNDQPRSPENTRAIGICGLIKRPTLADIDLGFAILPAYERRGYTREASHAILHFARHQLMLQRLLAIATPDNVASHALLHSLGFEEDGAIDSDGDSLVLFALSFETNESTPES
ncbi:MAG: GNAT family N-acetyltransferase [Phycisphaerae bacterium]